MPEALLASSLRSLLHRSHNLLTPLETPRAMLETGVLVLASPLLVAGQRADGHPVLVVPGLSAGSGWSTVLRAYLSLVGHSVHSPTPGSTKLPVDFTRRLLIRKAERLVEESGTTVSLVGWSVGGCVARQAVAERPDLFRQLVTLGTPLRGLWYSSEQQEARGRLPVPTTAIYSKTDGIFAWRSCVQRESRRAENVQVFSSHLGMASHPLAMLAVADRLGQPEGEWQAYPRFRFLSPESRVPRDGMSRTLALVGGARTSRSATSRPRSDSRVARRGTARNTSTKSRRSPA